MLAVRLLLLCFSCYCARGELLHFFDHGAYSLSSRRVKGGHNPRILQEEQLSLRNLAARLVAEDGLKQA